MAPVRELVMDVLKPHDPPLVEFTRRIGATDGVAGATASLIEHDAEVQNVKLTVSGDGLDVDAIRDVVEGLGGSVHSIDRVSCGDVVVADRPTPQDR